MSAQDTIKVGVVGYGNAAKSFHLPFVNAVPALGVVAVLLWAEAPADPASAKAGSHCTVDLPGIRHHRTADAFFADKDIDLVVVATHTDTHAPFAEKALLAGKHVIVDKPFARSTEEADRVIELAKERGLIVTCFQNRRWDSDFVTLRRILDKGALGDIKEAELHYDFASAPWLGHMTATEYTPGDGHMFGLGAHSIDQALCLFGRPKSVTGFLRAQRGIDSQVEDSFTVILQYGGDQRDLLVTIKTAVVSVLPQQLKHFIRGTKGSWVKEEQIAAGRSLSDPDFGADPPDMYGILTTTTEFDSSAQALHEPSGHYTGRIPSVPGRWVALYENLAGAIRGTEALEVQPTQSRDAIRVMELARESHDGGVTVPWS